MRRYMTYTKSTKEVNSMAEDLKRTVEYKPKSKEGLSPKGDLWLHMDVMNDEYERNTNRAIKSQNFAKSIGGLYIDLEKGRIDTSKLVKKPVQVKGQNGQTFTRMQWVDPKTGQPVSQKDAVDSHVKHDMSMEDRKAHAEKHGLSWKKNEHEQINNMQMTRAVKDHLYKNPHLIGADHLHEHDEDTPPQQHGIKEQVDAFHKHMSKHPEKYYQLMKEHGIADHDPRVGKEGDEKQKSAIQHMKNVTKMKAHLKENPHIMEHTEVPHAPAKTSSSPSRAEQGGNDIKGILKNMSPKEVYDLMKQHGIADSDPRDGKDGSEKQKAAIMHMRNMIALKSKIEKDPSILNLGSNGEKHESEVKRVQGMNSEQKKVEDVKNFLGGLTKEHKMKLLEHYQDVAGIRDRKRHDNANIDYMHGVTALRKHFEENPSEMSKHEGEAENDKLRNLKIPNKKLQKFLREELGLKGVGDAKQEEEGNEWSFGFARSSFARRDEDADGNPILSIVDTGKDGEEWNEHEIPMSRVKKFLDGLSKSEDDENLYKSILGDTEFTIINWEV